MDRTGLTICHECMLMLRRPKSVRQFRLAAPIVRQWPERSCSTTAPSASLSRRRGPRDQHTQFQWVRSLSSTPVRSNPPSQKDLKSVHNRIFELTSSALKPEDNRLPTEQRILYVLEQLDALAKDLVDAKSVASAREAREESSTAAKDISATSALLGSVNARNYPAFLSKANLLNLISEKAEEILRSPDVFITPAVLKSYVELQALLHHPSSFPDIFELYASKPIPKLASSSYGSQTIEYTPASPDKVNTAIDSATANKALTAAITAHNLPLCMDIINTTFSTKAFKRAKILRQAVLPSSILGIGPIIAYTIAKQYGVLQTTMDPEYATTIAFMGISAYLMTITGLGYVVVTTANDQMDRVTWAKGVPLWERWIREEERAALDRVAGKWGFHSLERRGEEEGEEWEDLREFIGLRGMVLDRVELMEGME